ncbi:MAG: hypothetical protein LBT62_07645 [Deltaproteobacteria bacterium]|jgi:hypothetical protein|nr:hypothetical protein [Deltaproteobacteria bacterium]
MSHGVALEETGAPSELAPWVPWVLYGNEDKLCPKIEQSKDFSCVWPLRLTVESYPGGGSFEGKWEVRAKKAVALPGQPQAWPVEVVGSRNGGAFERLLVVGQQRPEVVLEPGQYVIKGNWNWSNPPQSLTLPLGPILEIYLNNQRQSFPIIDEDYANLTASLWLQGRTKPPTDEEIETRTTETVPGDFLKIQIDRLVIDSQPIAVVTRLKLTSSGSTREELIKGLMLPETVPTYLSSSLPARLTAEGLRVQVQSGVHELFIESRAKGQLEDLGPVGDLYGPEKWAFVQMPHLRQVEIAGAPQVDPSQVDFTWDFRPKTNLDVQSYNVDYRNLPIYALEAGDSLTFTTLRRGDPEPGPDQLSLRRQCWLDFSGKGFTCRDHLTGSLRRQWHLTIDEPFALGQASQNGSPQVITWQVNSKGEKAPGLQLRQGALNLTADLRIEDFDGRYPASGWDHNLNSASQSLYLPAGYHLIHLSGASSSLFDSRYPGTWWDKWTTLDMFVVLAIILTVMKIFGKRWAILAALTMALSYHEFMAPRLVFLSVLGATALLGALPPAGKARFVARIWRLVSVILLVLFSVSFLIYQARIAIYPQLEDLAPTSFMSFNIFNYSPQPIYYVGSAADDYDQQAQHQYVPEPSYEMQEGFQADFSRESNAPKALPSSRSSLFVKGIELDVAESAQAQNTLARPKWSWKTIYLDFNEQISRDQTISLFYIGPRLSSFLCVVRLILMTWFVLVVASARNAFNFTGRLSKILPVIVGLAVLSLSSVSAMAQSTSFPSESMLKELEKRLLTSRTAPPPAISQLALSPADGDGLALKLTVHAEQEAIVPLPFIDRSIFQPTKAALETGEDLPILAVEDGLRIVLAPPGFHTVLFEGRLAKVDGFQLSFPQRSPNRVILSDFVDWRLNGVDPDGYPSSRAIYVAISQPPTSPASGANGESSDDASASEEPQSDKDGQVQTDQSQTDQAQTDQASQNDLAHQNDLAQADQPLESFFSVERVISLGVQWTVATIVVPQNPMTSPVSFSLPLLPGETPTSSDLDSKNGEVILNFSPAKQSIVWSSDLKQDLERPLTLTAHDGPYSESWSINASAIWRLEIQGLTPIYNFSPQGSWNPKWRPWAGESLTVAVSRPEPIEGVYTVIDEAKLETTLGQENREHKLSFSLRTSQGGPFSFPLPIGGEVLDLFMDGQNLPTGSSSRSTETQGPTVTLPVNPGEHRIDVTWLDPTPLASITTTPPINLGVKSSNIHYTITVPQDRWTLLVGGPVMGPAVLFWSFSGALLLLSIVLSRLRLTLLGPISWFLLFIGLSQLSLIGAFLVAAWLLLLGLRGKTKPIANATLFNLSQIGLLLLTFIALVLIYFGLHHALLSAPSMRITGNGSYDLSLKWFVDLAPSDSPWPHAWALTIPNKIYQYIMLAWALWLAISIIRWLHWGWNCFSKEKFWKKSKKPSAPKFDRKTGKPIHPESSLSPEQAEASEVRGASKQQSDSERQTPGPEAGSGPKTGSGSAEDEP